jgi:hypothetical protein
MNGKKEEDETFLFMEQLPTCKQAKRKCVTEKQ